MNKKAKDYFESGNSKFVKGDQDGAIADYDKAIGLNPDYADAYINCGTVKILKGDLEGALADFDKAIELNPDYAGAYNNRGNAKLHKGDQDGAIADYDKTIKLNPDYVKAYINRGNAKSDKDNQDGAIADYDKAIKLNFRYAGAYNNRGNIKGRKGDLDGALADYDKAIELEPLDVGAYNNRGITKYRKGDPDGALADYDKAIKLEPGDALSYYNHGIIKSDKGDLNGAISDFDKANEFNPSLSTFVLDLRIAKDTKELESSEKRILVFQLQHKVDKLLKTISERLEKRVEPMHYTNLNTLKGLVKGANFRLFNSSNMTDCSEGQIFFELLNLNKKKEDGIRQKFGVVHTSSVYLGSFIMDSHTDIENDMMWRTYGKHEGKENAGCALVFKRNIFADKWTSLIFHRALLQDAGSASKVEHVSHKELILFPVIYQSPKTMKSEIKDGLADLGSTLSRLRDIKCKRTIELISDMLGIVRFLFKNKKYSREQEARLVIWRKDSTGEVVKLDPFRRQYIECPLFLRSYQVIFGRNVSGVEDWKSWVKTESKYDIDVKVSY